MAYFDPVAFNNSMVHWRTPPAFTQVDFPKDRRRTMQENHRVFHWLGWRHLSASRFYPLAMNKKLTSTLCLLAASFCCALLAGCASFLPTSGPSSSEIASATAPPGAASIQIVDVDDAVARQLLSQRSRKMFSDAFGSRPAEKFAVGPGDVLEVSVWEAPPATLFGAGSADLRTPSTPTRSTTFPEQVVSTEGFINVPFAGQIRAAGVSLPQIETDVAEKLRGKANQPQVLVRLIRNTSSNVTVVGEVSASARVPLTPRGERLLDAVAAAGGVRQSVNKMTIQITRGSAVHALPLETIIRDPKQNILLQPGDVITALFQPASFTALGATGKNEEVNFEAQGISLAQALARSGGLVDARSNPQGVFIFRFEPKESLKWPREPVAVTPEGNVPVIYRIDLKNPSSFFVMQSFAMNDKDLLYVSNAPITEVQKFLNVVFSVAYPILSAVQVTR
jgi:polysaccharide biosynthesis/export protein